MGIPSLVLCAGPLRGGDCVAGDAVHLSGVAAEGQPSVQTARV